MKTFVEVLEEGKTEYSQSGHCFDTCMDIDEVLEYFGGKGMPVRDGVPYLRADGPGYVVNEDGPVYFNVFSPAQYPEDVGVEGLKSIIMIHPGVWGETFSKDDIPECKRELMELMGHHVENQIGAVSYMPGFPSYDLHAVNKV